MEMHVLSIIGLVVVIAFMGLAYFEIADYITEKFTDFIPYMFVMAALIAGTLGAVYGLAVLVSLE